MPNEKSLLCAFKPMCSARSTRASPQAPPCGAPDSSAPRVSRSIFSDSCSDKVCCASASTICAPCCEDAEEAFISRRAATEDASELREAASKQQLSNAALSRGTVTQHTVQTVMRLALVDGRTGLNQENARRVYTRRGRETRQPMACPSARSMTCAIVPPRPNELAPPAAAAVPRSPCGMQASCDESETIAPTSFCRICGFIHRNCALAGSRVVRSPNTTLSIPTMPAAGSACPMFPFVPPTLNEAGLPEIQLPAAAANVPASIGSPKAVPACCAWPFGAVRLALLPSWRTAEPAMQIFPRLSCKPSRITAPHASPRPKPSARESKVCDLPCTDRRPPAAYAIEMKGTSMACTPASTAVWDSMRLRMPSAL
eukprot:6471615-Prymnesium_polylepis.1